MHLKVMSGISPVEKIHKELCAWKIQADDNDICKIKNCITEKNNNPIWYLYMWWQKIPLINFVTGTVAPEEISLSLLYSKEIGL